MTPELTLGDAVLNLIAWLVMEGVNMVLEALWSNRQLVAILAGFTVTVWQVVSARKAMEANVLMKIVEIMRETRSIVARQNLYKMPNESIWDLECKSREERMKLYRERIYPAYEHLAWVAALADLGFVKKKSILELCYDAFLRVVDIDREVLTAGTNRQNREISLCASLGFCCIV